MSSKVAVFPKPEMTKYPQTLLPRLHFRYNLVLNMAIWEVFSHAQLHRYRSPVTSVASLVQFCISILAYIVPFVLIYSQTNFWILEARYREQPNIVFKKEFIYVLYTSRGPQPYMTYSTFDKYNKLQQKALRIPLIRSMEEDKNEDKRLDNLQLTMEVPIYDSEDVFGIELLLLFHYELKKLTSFKMESMAYIHYSSALPGAKIHVFGALETVQQSFLFQNGKDVHVNTPIIDADSVFASAYDLPTILKKYHERNVTTKLIEPYYVWTIGRGAKMPFVISVDIKYPEQDFINSFKRH